MSTRSYLARAVLLGLLLTSIAAPAPAQNAPTPALSAFNAAVYKSTKYDDGWRRSVASALQAWCEDLGHRTPRNTPAEDLWVDAEFADALSLDNWVGNDNKRMERVENSVEYARQGLSKAFSACASTAKSIQEGQKSRRDEALLWIDLVRFLSGSDDMQRLATIVGLLPRNFSPLNTTKISPLYEDEIGMSSLANLNSMILVHALIPVVKGE
jgi:hypothetical protein